MLCQIANLITEVPADDGMDRRCKDYVYNGKLGADICIRTELYRPDFYPPVSSPETIAYMESGRQFYRQLIRHNGFFIHASCVVTGGKAYLFSADSGVGKSTHASLWLKLFPDARIINDDKPALRRENGVWYAYGTPWCGKDGINRNEKAPVAGLCFLKQAPENKIRRLSSKETLSKILRQTIVRMADLDQLDALTESLNDFLCKIPVFELENLPNQEAVELCSFTIQSAYSGEPI